MQRDVVAILCFALFALLAVLAVNSVKKRAQNQLTAVSLAEVDSLTGSELAEAAGFYVSTVYADKPLERIAARGLLHRGNALLTVLTDGIVIDRTGELSLAIASSAICSVSRTSATIDKGVETNGLLAICWKAGEECLVTNLRIRAEDDTEELLATLNAISKKEANA